MPFPDLNVPTWEPTIHSLHAAALVVGRVQRAFMPRRRNAAHLPLLPTPFGLHTQPMPIDLALLLDYGKAAVIVHAGDGEVNIDLEGMTGDALLEALRGELRRIGASDDVTLESSLSDPLHLDRAVGAGYSEVQYAAFTAIARFKGRIETRTGPVAVFPHHFDLSTLIFAPGNSAMDENGPHLNIGFAPFTPGQYAHPYLYMTAYPLPGDFAFPALPDGAYWHREGWTGAVLRYDTIAAHPEPDWLIERTALAMYRALFPAVE